VNLLSLFGPFGSNSLVPTLWFWEEVPVLGRKSPGERDSGRGLLEKEGFLERKGRSELALRRFLVSVLFLLSPFLS